MKYIKIRARLQSENEVTLNEFLGSTIRGAIISEVGKLYCTSSSLECTTCKCGMTCPNRVLFNMKHYAGDDRISNPIVINANIQGDGSISLDIVLFGIGIMSADTITNILKQGIYLGKDREKFTAESVQTVNKYNKLVDTIQVIETSAPIKEAHKLTVNFVSPTHIQKDCMSLEFEHFLRSCMYRYMSLNRLTNSEEEIEFTDLIEKAKSVKLASKNIKLVNLGRFSGRTQTKNSVHCIKGQLIYEGDLAPFLQVLQFVEKFNIGKWSSMGLGKIRFQFE